MFKRPELPTGVQGEVFKDRVREGGCGVCDQLVDALLIGWWEVTGSQHHQPSGSDPSGGLHACGQHAVNFSHLVGTSVSAKQLKGHGSDSIICSP